MPKHLVSSDGAPKHDDAPATGLASALHSDTFEVSTRLTLNLIQSSIKDLQDKLASLDSKVDTLLTYTTPRHPCIFCEGDSDDGHRSSTCTAYSDTIARSLRLRDLNKCISCLAAAHGTCQQKCRVCGGNHHAILCSERTRPIQPQKRHRAE